MRRMVLLALLACCSAAAAADCVPFRKLLTGTAHRKFGLDAPVAMFAAQMFQESGCRPGITAWDGGKGLMQFMDPTAKDVARMFPDLGQPEPFNPSWAIPAYMDYMGWLRDRVKGDTDCDLWMAAEKGYNAGLGFVLKAQRKSPQPGIWIGVTEFINAGQGDKNFEYSRLYPRWIMFKHQPRFIGWSPMMCEGRDHVQAS